jgi:hypothetical protein
MAESVDHGDASMLLKTIRFFNLLLVALTLGVTFCHALEFPGKLGLDGADWLLVQHHLYGAFGVVGAVIEVTAIATTWIVLWQIRGWKLSRVLTLVAALCGSAALAVWFVYVDPVNAALTAWTPETLPSDWTSYRDQWEAGHAAGAVLFALAFSALVVALLSEVENGTRRIWS